MSCTRADVRVYADLKLYSCVEGTHMPFLQSQNYELVSFFSLCLTTKELLTDSPHNEIYLIFFSPEQLALLTSSLSCQFC